MVDNEGGAKKFGLGVLIGTIVGGITAFFLSPGTGEENREMVMKKYKKLMKWLDEADIPGHVMEIYGEVTEEGTKLYKLARKGLRVRMKDIEAMIEDFDADKYKQMVVAVVDEVKTEADETAKRAEKLKKYLMKRWENMTGEKKKVKV